MKILFMILEGLHEKEIFTEDFPFRIALNTEINYHYPSHWHKAVELIYSVNLFSDFHKFLNFYLSPTDYRIPITIFQFP